MKLYPHQQKRGNQMVMTITNFYNNVKYICKNKGIPIGNLEERVGISTGYLSRLCSESKELSVFKAYKIATILEVSLIELLEKEIWKEYRIEELKAELRMLEGGDVNETISTSSQGT